jgi:hypothetical protein
MTDYSFKDDDIWSYGSTMANYHWCKFSLSNGIYKIYEGKECHYLIAVGRIENSMQNGTWSYFYHNGRLHKQVKYDKGRINGLVRQYNHVGQLYAEFNYINDTLEGKQQYFGVPNYTSRSSSLDNGNHTHTRKKGFEVYQHGSLVASDLVVYGDVGIFRSWRDKDSGFMTNLAGNIISRFYMDSFKASVHEKSDTFFNLMVNEVFLTRYNDSQYGIDMNFASEAIYPTLEQFAAQLNTLPQYINLEKLYIGSYGGYSHDFDSLIQTVSGIGELRNLQEINIYMDNLSKVPDVVYQCENLRKLSIPTPLNKWLGERMDSLKTLESLEVWGDLPTLDNLILQASHMPNLVMLSLRGESNKFHQLKNLDMLTNIRQLELYPKHTNDNIFTLKLPIPNDVFKLQNLEFFSNSYKGDNYNRSYNTMLKKLPGCYYASFGTGCLIRGTMVAMVDEKFVPIEEIKVGDMVMGCDSSGKNVDTARVTKVYVHNNNLIECVELTVIFRDSLINVTATANHPIFSASGTIKQAGDIRSNDELYILSEGIMAPVKVVSVKRLPQKNPRVYNLETTRHSYFANGILVHNK